MYAAPAQNLPTGASWTYEPKFDGYRCLAARTTNGVELWSRRGNSFRSRFPAIAKACEKLPADTLVDGEVVAVDENGRPSFNLLQHSQSSTHLQYYVFDVLIHRGRSVLSLPLEKRRELLSDALATTDYPIVLSGALDGEPSELIETASGLGLEGIVAKRKRSSYESGRRSGAWLKHRINKGQEFVIGGYTHGNPFDGLIVGYYDGPKVIFVAKVRNGFVPRVRNQLYKAMAPLRIEQCPFVNLPEKRRTVNSITKAEMKNCQWLEPELVAQVNFVEWTPDGHLRHASFGGLREDKGARTVGRE
jgi:DNA ligase D-like protein (predicted ligase)